MSFPKTWKINEEKILLLGLAVALLITALTLKDYGPSYDEFDLYDFAGANLGAYARLAQGLPVEDLLLATNLRYYGPAYLIFGEIVRQPLAALLPGLNLYDTWHLVNFCTFLLGAWLLFRLCRRFVSERAALFAALLYLTQPLLWGHGIINPKDIPFLTAFLAAVLAGVRMVESWPGGAAPGPALIGTEPAPPKLSALAGAKSFAKNMIRSSRSVRGFNLFAALALAALALDRLFANWLSLPLINFVFRQAREAAPGTFLYTIFHKLADSQSTAAVAGYVEKTLGLLNLAEFGILFLAGAALAWLLLRRASRPARLAVLAGLAAGAAISIRVLGPAAAGLVLVYLLARKVRLPLGYLLLYLGAALLAALALWPYLWADPAGHFGKSLAIMAKFPWTGDVRFGGADYPITNLPWDFLARLIAFQFTLPLVVLAGAGIWLSAQAAFKRTPGWPEKLLPLAWFLGPLLGVLGLHLGLYDNFRQFLFMTPPLFILAGIGMERLLAVLRSPKAGLVLAAALLVPGIAAGIQLHPFEYVYYNALPGWTGQVQRQYETDYWGTSLCQAARFLDRTAPEGASVAFSDAVLGRIFETCARKQYAILVLDKASQITLPADYSVVTTRLDDDLKYFQNMGPLGSVGVGQTVFTVIRRAE